MDDEGSSVMLAETSRKSRTEEDLPAFSKEPALSSDQWYTSLFQIAE